MAEISLEDSTQDIDLELKHLPLSVSDRATSEDMLSYKEFTEPIANRIAQLTDEDIPITIGIFGEWGSGKTSFLKMLSDDLKKNSIDPIWFDAWKYDREDNLWSALLQCILNHIKINGNWHERQLIRIKLWVKTLRLKRGSSEIIKNTLSFFIKFTITFLFILLLFKFFLAFFNGIPPSLAELEAILKSISLSDLKVYYVFIALVVSFIIFKPDAFLNLFNSNINIDMSKFSEKSSYHDHIAYLDNFSEEFKNILKLVNNKNKPIVIIIDDLDRCLPEKALHILEGIKLFLDIEPCVYLLALDREFVEKIVLSKFKGLRIDKDSIRKLSEGYIEKFVQLQIAVPPIDKSIAKDFIKEMYSKIDENHSEHIAEILTSVVPPNPRKLKNILRTYVLMKMLADEKSKIEICPILLAKIVVIQSQFKELYRQIIEDPELLTEIERTVLEIKGIIKPEDYQKNDKFSEIAQSYLNKYSQLNEIFKDGNVGKRFIDCDSEVYIFFLRKLSSIIDDDKTDELQGDLKLPHLKIGELSDFGPLPPGSRLPFANNAVFTGRENELLKLANYLLHENRDANDEIRAAAVITGLEGIGKTQVAVEFCYRYGRFFQGVHWIQADRGISQEVAECGAAMSLDRWPDKTSEQAALTFKVWSEEKMHLLVVDNIEHIEDAQYLISSIPQTRLLLTSRRQNWPADLGIKVLPLDVLSNSQSKDLLRKLAPRLTDVPDKDLDLLTTRLYGHPLALDLAGRYLDDRSDLSLESYMDELQKCDSALEHVSLRNWVNHSPTKHMTRLETAFSLSWDQLAMDTVDELARCILRACGYCAPNTPIPLGIIKKIWVSKASDEEINRAVGRLSRLSLITITDKGPNLHPLLADFARSKDKSEKSSILPSLAEALVELTGNVSQISLQQMKPMKDHMKSVAQAAEAEQLQIAGLLWNHLGSYLRSIAEFGEATKSFEKALQIDEKTLGQNHPDVARDLNNLGLVLQETGNLPNAKACFERAFEIDEKTLGPNHPIVADRINNLGLVLRDLGELENAKKNFEQALEIDEKSLGSDNPTVAIRINNLGLVLRDLGDLEGSKKNFEQALEIDEKALGPDHPTIAIRVNNLGSVLKDLGELEEARRCLERALAIDEKAFGFDHPTVAIRINNLGLIYKDLKHLDDARDCFERALKILQRMGDDHPLTSLVKNNLTELDDMVK